MREPSRSFGRSSYTFEKHKRALRAQKRPCAICGMAIDYSLNYPHPESFSVDHRIPRSQRPDLAEDPGNLQASHLRCNQGKSDNAQFAANLGYLSEEF